MNAIERPIHLPGTAALDSLRQRAQAAFDAWAREWVSGRVADGQRTAELSVCALAGERSHAHEYEAVRSEAGCMWFRCSAADYLNFGSAVAGAELMPGSAYVDDWIADVIDCARNARNRALCSALLGTPVVNALPPSLIALPANLFAFGSGAVQLSCDALGLHVIADSAIWRSVPPSERAPAHRRAKLMPLDRAARRAKAKLDVMLGSVEVELPKLLDLRCGDVLRLPQRLDQGIAVLCEGKPLARAALGETHGRKCVQMI